MYVPNFTWNCCCKCSFLICTAMYAGVAYMGYTMFGESTLSQFTLNMPQDLVATKIAVWTTVCSWIICMNIFKWSAIAAFTECYAFCCLFSLLLHRSFFIHRYSELLWACFELFYLVITVQIGSYKLITCTNYLFFCRWSTHLPNILFFLK